MGIARSQQKEIIKLRKEINKIEMIQTIKKIIECRNAQEYRDFQLTKYLESTLTENASLKTIKKILTEANFLQGRPNGADYFFIRPKKRNYTMRKYKN